MSSLKHVKKIVCYWTILATIAILANGCALTPDHINLEYMPQAGAPKVDGANLVEVTVKVTDLRTIKHKVSCKKNGYGMEMADIISNNDVITLVANAIESELSSRGFKVTKGSVLVNIEVNKFYNDFKMGFWSGRAVSEILMNVQVKKSDGNIKYVKSIKGSNTETGVMIYSGKNAKISLEKALKNAISKLMYDPSFIASLLEAKN